MSPKIRSMNYSSKVDEYNKQVHGIEKKDYSGLVEKVSDAEVMGLFEDFSSPDSRS
jgi:hypothetical protein